MRTIEKTIYKFSELSEGAKKRVIEKEREHLRQADFWHEYLTKEWAGFSAQIGFEDAQIAFSGFWSQGDGASFTSGVNVEKLVSFFTKDISPRNSILEDGDALPLIVHNVGKQFHPEFAGITANDIALKVIRTDSHYCHEKTCYVDCEVIAEDESREALLSSFVNAARDLRYKLSNAIYKALEAEYNYHAEDAQLIESIEINDCEFYEDGKPFRG